MMTRRDDTDAETKPTSALKARSPALTRFPTLDKTMEALLERRRIVRQSTTAIIGKIEDLLPIERPPSDLKELLRNLTEYREDLKQINREIEDNVDIDK